MDLNERIGAWLTPGGCFFRVWAPHAEGVSVLFQPGPYWEVDDAVTEHALAPDGDYWSATVPGVEGGQLYRFRIETPGGEVLQRLDPAARDVLNSELTRQDPSSRNGSIVLGDGAFDWAPFETPRFENFIIYQFHFGSFAGRADQFDKPWASFEDVESKLDYVREMGFNFEGGRMTQWGRGPAWWKAEVRDFFYQNARMFFEEYRADGLRFDVTTQIDGEHLKLVVGRLREDFPDKYLVAEHLPDDPWIIGSGRFCAAWHADSHHECQRALAGQDSLNKVKGFLGWDGYGQSWNLVKYTLGSHDDVGDQENGDAEHGLTNWDSRHRYLVDQLGGRGDWTARAKCRLAWALNVAMPGTPLMFMGTECHMASPHVAWGYWHDGEDGRGDHRFDWAVAGDPFGVEMRRLVGACNAARWRNPALRAESLTVTHEDHANQVLGFVRRQGDNVVLVVVNLGERNFGGHGYGVRTGGLAGRWMQVLCTQDADFGGWDGAGNAFHEPWTQA